MALVLLKNVAVPPPATAGNTSTVGEPSVASNGDQIYYCGNWYAARSLDGAATWSYIDSANIFPPAASSVCCDQTMLYVPSHDLTVWLLQYFVKNRTNILRLAVKKGTGGAIYDFVYDLTPGAVDPAWAEQWFDYNSAAVSNNFLYVTSNVYTAAEPIRWARAIVFRIPLSVLATGGALTYDYLTTTTTRSLRCTQGATGTMYIGTQTANGVLRVYTWPETSASATSVDVTVNPWGSGPYAAPGPDGHNWLTRATSRITGAFLAKGVIGFLWTSSAHASRPMPYIRVARLDAATKTVIDQPDIWSSSFAYAYPDAAVNDVGQVGVTMFRGGGPIYPSHLVGVWRDATNDWELTETKAGTNGPEDTKWGDYLTCRRHAPDGLIFAATGFTLQGGASPMNIEPRYVRFGTGAALPTDEGR
jgi:hypothetical protein